MFHLVLFVLSQFVAPPVAENMWGPQGGGHIEPPNFDLRVHQTEAFSLQFLDFFLTPWTPPAGQFRAWIRPTAWYPSQNMALEEN